MTAPLQHKWHLDLQLTFTTAFRVGSGREGETMSDMGVVRTPAGDPYIPGSSLKGKLRVTAERLAPHLGLSACLLDSALSGVECCNCQQWSKQNKDRLKKIREETNTQVKLQQIDGVTCDVCKLFGSPLRAGRLFVSDGTVEQWSQIVQVRDGVVIDRDSETTVDHLKYDYETIPVGASFAFSIDIEDPNPAEQSLVGAVLLEWEESVTLGGFGSRGLGRAKLTTVELKRVDLSDPAQRFQYLLKRTWVKVANWKDELQKMINAQLSR